MGWVSVNYVILNHLVSNSEEKAIPDMVFHSTVVGENDENAPHPFPLIPPPPLSSLSLSPSLPSCPSMGAPVMVELEGETDPLKIAMKELK